VRTELSGRLQLAVWTRIGTDGNATVCTGKVELGQGVIAAPDGRKLSYSELAAAVGLHREATAQASS